MLERVGHVPAAKQTVELPPLDGRKRVLVIVPAFNEEESLAPLLETLGNETPFADVLVVNDGSRDRTGQIAASVPGVAVINLPVNLGIGGAVQTGFKYAARKGYSIALQVDGDGQHHPSEIEALIAPIERGEADMVIGSRYLDVQSFRSTAARRLGIGIFSWVNSLVIGQRITDNTSGFRAYSREAIKFLAHHYPTDYPEPEAVVLLGMNHFKIREIGVAMQERQGGVSSIRSWKAVYYMIKVLLAIFVNVLRPELRARPEVRD